MALFLYSIKNIFLQLMYFFKHWYLGGFYVIYGNVLKVIRDVERNVAIKINIKFLFKPLYQEYNFVGYVLGVLLRIFKICWGGLLYIFIVSAGIILYLIWSSIPIFIIYKAIINF